MEHLDFPEDESAQVFDQLMAFVDRLIDEGYKPIDVLAAMTNVTADVLEQYRDM